ncbi:MAG TPA: efflux transporter outer membrane subunit [Burkholderiales bacterium]|nr:efflux transporter outer membrane subunit [Burkholderiales bacterium]
MRRLIFASVWAGLAVSVGVGCTVGPDFNRPSPPKVSGYTAEPLASQTASAQVAGGEAQRFALGRDIAQQWWTLFRCPELNALIEQALKANPDMQVAQAALRQAMELVYAQQGFYYPSVQAGVAASRQQNAVGTLAPTLTSGAPLFNLYTAEVGVSYTLDAFGANRRQVESLKAQAEFERFQLEATYLTLTSNVVVAAVQEASLRAQIAATEQVIQLETEVVQIFRRQHELGAIAMADVVAQEATLGQLQATLPALQKQLAQQRDLLARLAGRLPNEELAERFELSRLELPQELPVSLPSKLIEQRPDVRAAEAQLHSASAQVGVAIANMLPQITLSAGAGTSATQLSQWFVPGNQFWLLGGSLTQTLFDGGTLLHRKRAAEAALDQAGAQYRASVLTAFQNVADTLRALQYDADALKAQVAAERAASESLAIARKALDLGSISYLSLLNAEQTYEQTLISLVQAKANRYADTAALFQALGGGWWNRPNIGALASSSVGEKRASP